MNVKREPTAAPGKATPAPARTTKAEQSEATRAALIEAARPLFAERGYAAVAAGRPERGLLSAPYSAASGSFNFVSGKP